MHCTVIACSAVSLHLETVNNLTSRDLPSRSASRTHRRSQGVQWVHLHPPGRWKKLFFRPNLQEKCVSAPPQDTKCTPPPARARVNFRTVFAGGLDLEVYLEVYLDVSWGRRLKKVVNFVAKKKCTPDKILVTPMAAHVFNADSFSPLEKNSSYLLIVGIFNALKI